MVCSRNLMNLNACFLSITILMFFFGRRLCFIKFSLLEIMIRGTRSFSAEERLIPQGLRVAFCILHISQVVFKRCSFLFATHLIPFLPLIVSQINMLFRITRTYRYILFDLFLIYITDLYYFFAEN